MHEKQAANVRARELQVKCVRLTQNAKCVRVEISAVVGVLWWVYCGGCTVAGVHWRVYCGGSTVVVVLWWWYCGGCTVLGVPWCSQ